MATAQVLPDSKAQKETSNDFASPFVQVLVPEQSLEFVKTLLHGSMSCICYLRNLFSDSCFDERLYSSSNVHWSYNEYVSGKYHENDTKQNSPDRGTRMKLLKRGKKEALDQLLDWLEKGAFDALKWNNLKALQLRILENPNAPEVVLETYTFTFNYTQTSSATKHTTNFDIKGTKGSDFTVNFAQIALQKAIRALVAYCNTLPMLPENIYLAMVLFYTEDARGSYNAPGFEYYEDFSLFYQKDNVWELKSLNCGSFKTPFHHVDCVISHLDVSNSITQARSQSEEIPSGLHERQQGDSMADIVMGNLTDLEIETQAESKIQGLDNSAGAMFATWNPPAESGIRYHISSEEDLNASEIVKHRENSEVNEISSAVEIYQQKNDRIPQSQQLEAHLTKAHLPSNAVTVFAGDETQSTNDLQFQNHLANLLQPSLPRESDVPTQIGENSRLHDTAILSSVASDDTADNVNVEHKTLQLSQWKLAKLEEKHDILSKHLTEITDSDIRIESSGQTHAVVRCQCDFNAEEGEMIFCKYCHTWQHLHCYGYRTSEDPRLPVKHACYQCLLEEEEEPLLGEMKNLILLRRAVYLIENIGYSSDKALANDLGCNLHVAARISADLKKEGFLVSKGKRTLQKSRSKSKRTSGIVKEGPAFAKLLQNLFDPTSKIAHHFSTPCIDTLDESLLQPSCSQIEAQDQKREWNPTFTSHASTKPCQGDLVAGSSDEAGLVIEPATPKRDIKKRNTRNRTVSPNATNKPRKRLRMSKTKDYIDVAGLS